MAKKSFLRSLVPIFWLGILAFVAYRAFAVAPLGEGRRYLVYSRFNGYQNQILEPGQYFISWQNLLPGNIRFLSIPLRVQSAHFRKRFVLPSAEAYRLLLPRLNSEQVGQPSTNPFAYQIEMIIEYRLRPKELLATLRNIGGTALKESVGNSPKNFSGNSEAVPKANTEKNTAPPKKTEANTEIEVLGSIAEDIAGRSRRRLNLRVNQELESLFSAPNRTIAELQEYFGHIVSEEFPELELLEVSIDEYRAPDLELYATVRKYYEGLLEQISAESLARLLEQQDQRVAEQLYLQNLERIGQILARYPVLLQYFSIIQGKNLPELPDIQSNRENILPQIPAIPNIAEQQ